MFEKRTHMYEFGEFCFDANGGLLLRNDEQVPLPPKVAALLRELLERRGRVATKDELIRVLWPDTFVEETTLHVYVSTLRKALGQTAGRVTYIETVPRRGYRFAASVLEPAAGADEARAASESTAAGRPVPAGDRRTNLPQDITSFVGRSRQLVDLRQRLETARLVTLTGMGGVGKTRLALELARRMVSDFSGGVWLIEFAALDEPALVPQTIAAALGVREEHDRSVQAALAERLGSERTLIVLDNCEHLAEACAELAGTLVRACPDLHVLATSREPLGVAGEAAWSVPPLSVPDAGAALRVDQLFEYGATSLFMERAALARPGFAVGEETAPLVVELCRRLDGLPLAVELAAARVRVLAIEQILERLGDRFRLLARAEQHSPLRQRTLRATIDWSYDLLSDEERLLFARLSVFAGGWTINAAESVCSGDGIAKEEVLDLLAYLVAKSLVVAGVESPEARYWMPETIREYAWEKLEESGEGESLVACHQEWFSEFAEAGDGGLYGPDQGAWVRRLEADHDNLRAALRRSLQGEGNGGIALRLCRHLAAFWHWHGYVYEGRRWVEAALARSERAPTVARGQLLFKVGQMADFAGDYARSRPMLEDALALQRSLGDRSGVCRTLYVLSHALLNAGQRDRAVAMTEESQRIARDLGDWHMVALTSMNLGHAALDAEDFDRAEHYYAESLAIHRRNVNERSAALLLSHLGQVAYYQGDFGRAERHLRESVEIARALGDDRILAESHLELGRIAAEQGEHDRALALQKETLLIFRKRDERHGAISALEAIACTVAAHGHAERALCLAAAASRLLESIDAARTPAERRLLDRFLAPSLRALGAREAQRAEFEGRAMSFDEAVEYALMSQT